MICRFDSEDLNRKESLTILYVDMLDLQGYKIGDHSWILFAFGLSSHHGSHSMGRRRDIRGAYIGFHRVLGAPQ